MSRPLLEGFTCQIRMDYYVSVLIIDVVRGVLPAPRSKGLRRSVH
jgi:hypothetical protein